MSRCQAVHQNHPIHASREKKVRSEEKTGPQKTFPEKPGPQNKKAQNKREGPREAWTLTKQKPSQRSQHRKAKANKWWGGLRDAREPNKLKVVPEKPTQKSKAHKELRRPREAETLKQ